ncbi:hypothetical protein K438DRAFT_1764596 [Mycena galopus ATCC 62051]|nr:hypothetical protein K438DRAFT_1764596 [Mycena galopus ATCC 62051]
MSLSLVKRLFASLVVASLVAASAAQSSTTLSAPTPPTSTSSIHMSHEVRVIVAISILVGVLLIVTASYFCCCHAACRATRMRTARGGQDAEDGNGRREWQRHDAGVPTPPRTSTDKGDNDRKDSDTGRNFEDAEVQEFYALKWNARDFQLFKFWKKQSSDLARIEQAPLAPLAKATLLIRQLDGRPVTEYGRSLFEVRDVVPDGVAKEYCSISFNSFSRRRPAARDGKEEETTKAVPLLVFSRLLAHPSFGSLCFRTGILFPVVGEY